MGFFDLIRPYANIRPSFFINFTKQYSRPLLEIHRIDSLENIVSFTEIVIERMNMMLSGTVESIVIDRITTNFIEVCQNIEHSEDIGYVSAQRYDKTSEIKIAVMDLGIGITKSLKNKYKRKNEEWSDSKAIELALQPDVSSRDTGGGLGLAQLRNFIINQGHSEFIIRTGSAKYIISSSGNIIKTGLTRFPGTQISVIIKP